MKKILNGSIGLLMILSTTSSYADDRGDYSYETLPQGTVIHLKQDVLFPANTQPDMWVGSCDLTLGNGAEADHDRILHPTDLTVVQYLNKAGLLLKDSSGQQFVLDCSDGKSINQLEKENAGVFEITLPSPHLIGSAMLSRFAQLNDSAQLLTTPHPAEIQVSLNTSKEPLISATGSQNAVHGTENADLAE